MQHDVPDVNDPGWNDALGYMFDFDSRTLYLPVSKRYLVGRDLDRYEVLIWSQPRVLVVGRLSPVPSDEDVKVMITLAAARGREPDKIGYMLFDQRHHKLSKNRYRFLIESVCEAAI